MRAVARVVAGSAGDRCGVVGICARCDFELTRYPNQLDQVKRAMVRALQDPSQYYCAQFNDLGTAMLAAGLMGHPDFAVRAMDAVGWI